MNITEFTDSIYYVGVNDRVSPRFEGLWDLPNGISYNSYIIKGEKIALIDTVHISQSIKFLNNISSIIGDADIDYLVINHMEPDHSGSIQFIKARYPNIQIVGNTKTTDMLKGFYGITDNIIIIKDRDTIDLGGGKILEFILTPMIHWPETMMTYETSTKALFTGDAFGCFGALNGGIIDNEMNIDSYIPEMYRYFSNIVAKYSPFVQKALSKLSKIELNYICTTHGPVWNEHVPTIIKIYDDLSSSKCEDGVVIAYGTMYGNTEEIVETIAGQLAKEGVRNIKIYNVSSASLSQVLSDVCRYKGLIIGGPTYSNSIFPPIEELLSAIQLRELKNKVFASFGAYTWAPGIVKKINTYTEKLSFSFVENSIEMKQSATPNNFEDAKSLAKEFARMLKEE